MFLEEVETLKKGEVYGTKLRSKIPYQKRRLRGDFGKLWVSTEIKDR